MLKKRNYKKGVIQIVLLSLILLGSIIAYIGYNLNFKTYSKDIYNEQKLLIINNDLKKAIGTGIEKVLEKGFNDKGRLLYENYPYPINDFVFEKSLINSINLSIKKVINKYAQKGVLGKNYNIKNHYTIKIVKKGKNYILHIYNLSLIYHNNNIFIQKNLDPKLNLTDLFTIKNKVNEWLNNSAYNFTLKVLNLINGSCGSGCSCDYKKALLPEKPKFNKTKFYKLFNKYFSELNTKYFNNTNVYCIYNLGKVIFNENHGFESLPAGQDTYCGKDVNKITTNYSTNAQIWLEDKTIVDDMTLSYNTPNIERVKRKASRILPLLSDKPTQFNFRTQVIKKVSAHLNKEVYEPSLAMNAFITCYYKRNTSLVNLPNKIFIINFAYRLNFIKLCQVKNAKAEISKYKASLPGNCAKYEGCDEKTGAYKYEYDRYDPNRDVCNNGPFEEEPVIPQCPEGTTLLKTYTAICKSIDNSVCQISYICQEKKQNNGGQDTLPTPSEKNKNNNNNNEESSPSETGTGSESSTSPPSSSGGTTTGPVTQNTGNQNPSTQESTPPAPSPPSYIAPNLDNNFNGVFDIN